MTDRSPADECDGHRRSRRRPTVCQARRADPMKDRNGPVPMAICRWPRVIVLFATLCIPAAGQEPDVPPGISTLPIPLDSEAHADGPSTLPVADAPGSMLPVEPGVLAMPGQAVYPIDLAGAMRLAGARDLDIAIARARVAQAVADLSLARAIWLPSLFLGPNWIRHDGSAQIVEGPVQQISKSSLFLGATTGPRPGDHRAGPGGRAGALVEHPGGGPNLRRDLRPAGGPPGRHGQPGRRRHRHQRRPARPRRGVPRPPARRRPPPDRPRGRRPRRGPRPADRLLRPDRRRAGGRSPPRPGRAASTAGP